MSTFRATLSRVLGLVLVSTALVGAGTLAGSAAHALDGPSPPPLPGPLTLPGTPIVPGSSAGYLPGSWGVEANGAVNYTIPLAVPRGSVDFVEVDGESRAVWRHRP